MAFRCRHLILLHLFLFYSFLSIRSEEEAIGSVFFIDSATHKYFRARSPDDAVEQNKMSLPEVGATVSVLLGLPPPATLSAAASSRLNEVLKPNPFDRPHAALLIEIGGLQDSHQLVESDLLRGAQRKSVFSREMANIQLQEDKVSVVSVDESVSLDSDPLTDEAIHSFAYLMGGTYTHDGKEVLVGNLTIPLGENVKISLSLSKKAEKDFTASIISLVRNIKRAIEMHEDLSRSIVKPAELIKGSFDIMKVLQENYGADSVAEQRTKLLLAVLAKVYNSLQAAYDGKIVGIIFFNNDATKDALVNVVINSHPSARIIKEKESTPSAADVEKLLVRRTLAWLTGLILLISTLLGIYFLLYMPLTKDTLLYSNVKLD
ncbi:hypothetical protein SAY86_011077 [Trapa natans]|uniref:DUF7794 domain-containing protein n=1 Tax=Trapa natans TaxID=22666 RepID=A0AAN7LMN8_TRANT|nr:hypothetical protein SAY86_011077 [Trapa natans]